MMDNQDRYLINETAMQVPYDRNKSYISLEPFCSSNHNLTKSYQSLPFSLMNMTCEPLVEQSLYPDRAIAFTESTNLPNNDKIDDIRPLVLGSTKKRGRKPKNSSMPSRSENKMNRNSNKQYINYKGIQIEPKTFIDYQCKCIKKCSLKLSAENRMSEFEKFWALSAYDSQTAFIAAKVTEHPVKRRYGKNNGIKKDFSRTYSLCSTAVCRDMFCRTLQISSGRINTALTKIRTRTAIKDQRGIRKLAGSKSVSDRRNSEIRNIQKNADHIESVTENIKHFLPPDKSNSKDYYLPENIKTSNNMPTHVCPINNEGSCGYPPTPLEISNNSNNNILDNRNLHMNTVPICTYNESGIALIGQHQTESASNPMEMCSIVITESSDNLPCNAMKGAPKFLSNSPSIDDRPKKGRKPKYNQSRQENKVNRNNNRAYVNYKGVLVEPKKFIDFQCNCSKKCYQIIGSTDRSKEFEKFWALPYDSQTAYIVAAVSEQPVKRRYAQKNETKKDFTRKYALGSIAVCRDMFCRTLHISPGRINTALKKYRLRSALTDQRGIKQGGHNRLPAEKRSCVIRFIKRIPVYKSHYCKERSKSRYLPPEMTLTKLYELYKEEEKDNAVSNASFKKIFYSSFNLRSKETCHICDTLNNQLRKDQTSTKSHQLKQKYDGHRAAAEKAQKYLEHDMLLAKKYPEVECLTFDMERTLPLPRIPTNMTCYKRLLWLYNMSVHSSKKDQGYCYVWPEGQAGKGAQEVGSCLLKHAKEEIMWSPDLCHLILWTDSCGGLNRNIKLTLMLKSLLQSCPTLKTIKLKFLETGHSSLPNQRDFGDIERALKNQTHLYTPDDYMNIMRYCRKKKPLIVKSMNHQEFLSTEQLEKHILNSNISTEKEKINWLEVREISMFVHDPFTIYFKTDFDGDAINMDFRPRPDGQQIINFMHLLVPLWPLGKPITPAKLKDLKSILHMIPVHAKNFYSNLQCGTNNDEDVDGLNEELDFDIEYK